MRDAVISFPLLGENFSFNPPSSISIGGFQVYFYGIIIAFGLLMAVWYCVTVCKRFDITADSIYGYLIWAVIAAVIGARLYYCITYTQDGVHTYFLNPISFLWIRDGGLAIYGGVIGAALGIFIRSRIRKESIWPPFDIMGMGLLIGQSIGRWGNFFNREAFGYETGIFCRMGLTQYGETIYVHPTFLYESLWNALGFLLLHLHSKKYRQYEGQYFLLYLIWYGFGRMFIEGLRSDSLWLIPDSIRISQLLAAVTFACAGLVYLVNRSRLRLDLPPLVGAPALPRPEPVSAEAEAEQTQTPLEGAEQESAAQEETAGEEAGTVIPFSELSEPDGLEIPPVPAPAVREDFPVPPAAIPPEPGSEKPESSAPDNILSFADLLRDAKGEK